MANPPSLITPPSFEHVLRLSDEIGIFEHAEHTTPRPKHGYCVDDVARLLIVIAREPEPDRELRDLARIALRFLADAQAADGTMRNRCSTAGRWKGPAGVDDCWGRAIWAFGTAARHAHDGGLRQAALAYFGHSAPRRSPHTRSMAFAALGAAEILETDPRHYNARRLLAEAATMIGRFTSDASWPWPEPRLTYANAVLPEALIAAGHHLGRPEVLDDGLQLLRWLLDRETIDQHLSPTPVGGSVRGDSAPAFDQQPIEVAAMADACNRAYLVTRDTDWLSGIQMAGAWFDGDNDAGSPMFDSESGGGYDGLHSWGPNLNQGAESTLAMLTTRQHAHRLATNSDEPNLGTSLFRSGGLVDSRGLRP